MRFAQWNGGRWDDGALFLDGWQDGIAATIARPPETPDAVTNISSPLVLNGPYAIAAGDTVNFDTYQALQVESSQVSIDIAGTMTVTDHQPMLGATAIADLADDDRPLTVEKTGALEVTSTDPTVGAEGLDGGQSVYNNGLFTVDAAGYATGADIFGPNPDFTGTGQAGVFNAGVTKIHAGTDGIGYILEGQGGFGADHNAFFDNSGALSVTGGDAAIGAILEVMLVCINTGTITVKGGDVAIGIKQSSAPEFVNTGTIHATVTDHNFASIGYLATDFTTDGLGRQEHYYYTNSGTITGDYAFYAASTETSPFGTPIEILANSGTLHGAVQLGFGNDLVINTGKISGEVLLDAGDDIYSGNGARAGVAVDGGAGSDRIVGGKYGDVLYGGDDSDAILGGDGDDVIDGGRGNNALDGGAGFNTLSYLTSHSGVTVNLAAGTGATAASSDAFRNFEAVMGSQYDDTVIGSSAADQLEGNSGNDVLSGGGGNDVLIGDAGDDTMTGGTGKDVFVFSAGDGADTVTDFQVGGGGDTLAIYGYAIYQSLVQQGSDTLVVLDAHNSILLKGVNVADLTPSNFAFDSTPLTPPPVAPADQTELLANSFAIAQGEYFNIVDPQTFSSAEGPFADSGIWFSSPTVEGGLPRTGEVFLNAGHVRIEGTLASGTITGLSLANALGKQIVNQATGLFEVVASGGENARGIFAEYQVWNQGHLLVSSAAGSATGVVVEAFDNSGVITIAAAQAATGVWAIAGPVFNSGDIEVSGGAGSIGVYMEQMFNLKSWGAYRSYFVNSGTIHVTDTTAALDSVGIHYESSQYVPFWNSGTVRADYAIESFDSSSEGPSDHALIYNSGTLDGLVSLNAGPAQLYNSGTITGHIDLGDGADLYDGRHGTELGGVDGGAAADTLLGGLGSDTLSGGGGNDILSGGAGDDILKGGIGKDTFRFETGSGHDTIADFHSGEDTIAVVGYASYLSAVQQGADTLITFSATDSLLLRGVTASTLTAADFQLSAAPIADTAMPAPFVAPDAPGITPGTAAPYIMEGTSASEALSGGIGDDYIQGLAGSDTLSGLDGNDRIEGGKGNDKLFGGDGDDHLYGGDGNDILDAGLGNNTLDGGAGADTIIYNTHAGRDYVLHFDPSQDVLRIVIAGDGTTHFSMVGALGYLEISLQSGGTLELDIDPNASGQLMSAIQLWGTSGDDILAPPDGNVEQNVHQGSPEFGLDGNDALFGADFNDTLDGGKGNDTLNGAGGDDILIGGRGVDTMSGSWGVDTFVFQALADSSVKHPDLITDLDSSDIIDLSAIDADTTKPGDQAFALVSAFDKHPGQLTLTYNATTNQTTLAVDVNGDGHADFAVLIAGHQTGTDGWLL